MSELFRLDGEVALVTGASSGLGWRFAKVLAGAGARLAIGARRRERLEELAAELRGAGAECLALSLDVTDEGSVEAAVAAVVEAYGGVDVLVNNAGVARPCAALELSEGDWDQTLETNLKGAWRVATVVARAMVAVGRGGRIVNIASVAGERVAGELSAYCASKAGLVQLTRSHALEWARHGIRVNALAPGYVLTEMNAAFFASDAGARLARRIPQRRVGEPRDLSGPLLLLCSQASSYMTGSVVTVDGGHRQASL